MIRLVVVLAFSHRTHRSICKFHVDLTCYTENTCNLFYNYIYSMETLRFNFTNATKITMSQWNFNWYKTKNKRKTTEWLPVSLYCMNYETMTVQAYGMRTQTIWQYSIFSSEWTCALVVIHIREKYMDKNVCVKYASNMLF